MRSTNTPALPRDLYVISIGAFLFQLTECIVQPILTLYLLELGATKFQVGLVLSIQSLSIILLRIPLTLIARRVGERRWLGGAFLIQTTTYILYSLVRRLEWFYLIPFFQVIATGAFNQISMSLVSNMAPTDRQGDALGRYMTIFSMGRFIGPMICSGLVIYMSYRHLFLISALFPIVGLILFYIGGSRGVNPRIKVNSHRPNSLKSLRRVLKERNMVILSIIRTSYSMSNMILNTLFAIYATQELGLSSSVVALLFSVIGFTNAFIKLPAGWLSDRLGGRRVLLITYGIIIFDYLGIAYAKNFVSMVVLLTIFGVCWGTRAVTELAFLGKTVSPEIKSLAISYLSTFWGIGSTLGSYLAGSAADVLSYSTIFILAALINLPAVLAIHFMKED